MANAPVPPLEEMEQAFETFEEDGWRLSLPAKVVIQQGFISIGTDRLGMGSLTTYEQRQATMNMALGTLPAFLARLKDAALQAQEQFPVTDPTYQKTIGAIFVLQHMKGWGQSLMKCSCWPD